MHDPTALIPAFGILCGMVIIFEDFSQRAHVRAHTVQHEINLATAKNYEYDI